MAGEGGFDTSSLMNVLPLYACKVCAFQTTCRAECDSHVRDKHLPSSSKDSSKKADVEPTAAKSPDTRTVDVPPNSGATELQESAPADPPSVSQAAPLPVTLSSDIVNPPMSFIPASEPAESVLRDGVSSSEDSTAVVMADSSSDQQTQGPAILGGASAGINYILLPKDLGQRQQGGELIQVQIPEGVLTDSATASSIGMGDFQVTPQQLQQILEATKSSSTPVTVNGGGQISLVPVSVGGQSAPHQLTIVTNEDGQVLSLAGPLLNGDNTTPTLAIKADQLFQTGGPGGKGEAMLLNLGPLNGLGGVLDVSGLATNAAPNAPPPAATTQEILFCGDCHITFPSQKAFVQHVRTDHPKFNMVALTTALKSPPDGNAVRGHSASVGTQVCQKRPGRKRKSEMVAKEDTKDSVDDSDDEDWKPGVSESGRRKRKARAPRNLRENYYLENNNKNKRKRKAERDTLMEDYRLRCSVIGCLSKFRTQAGLDLHTSCHNEEDQRFTCKQCQQQFDYWKHLRIHLWREHGLDPDLFSCDSCNFKADTCHKLMVHKETHGEARSYTCDECGKGFKQYSQLRNHQVTHISRTSSDPNKWYSSKKCTICGRGFANSKCLKKHVQAVHCDERPFKCPHRNCGYDAPRKAMMELHIRTHTGEKPYKCDVCDYASGDHNSLRRHKMRHTGEYRYHCRLCPYGCIQAISLKTHMTSKHPGHPGVFTCTLCSYRTVNEINFRNHTLDHENGIVTTRSRKRNNARVSQAQPQNQLSESVVMVAGDGDQVQQVLEVPEVQLTVTMQHSGTTTVPDHEFQRLVELEPMLQISAHNFLQYALAAIPAIPAAASATSVQPNQLRMTLPGNMQVNLSVSSVETADCSTHTIVVSHIRPIVQQEGAGVDTAALEGVEEGGLLEGQEEMQVVGVPGTQVEGQILYISQDSSQPGSAGAPQEQPQNVSLEFATVTDGSGDMEPGVVAMDTQTVQMENIKTCASGSNSPDALAASPSSA